MSSPNCVNPGVSLHYDAWRDGIPSSSKRKGRHQAGAPYADLPGFCKSAALDRVRKHGRLLTPGRHVGAEVQGDDGEPFQEKMKRFVSEWRKQRPEAARLDAPIEVKLKKLRS